MKKLILALGIMLSAFCTFAQREKATAYIQLYKEAAMAEMLRSGVPASITLAQGMLESGYGESDLCKRSNNHFGIKCKENWTGEKVYHDDDEKGECFRAYPTAADSYKDHSDFLKTRPWYAFLFKLDLTDYEGWAKGLKKAGYATEKDYPKKLMEIINNYDLQQYTILAIKRKEAETAPLTDVSPRIAPATDTAKVVEQEKDEPADTSETVITVVKKDSAVKKTSKYGEGILIINHTKAIYGKEGTSLLALANQYGITLSKLVEFNDMQEMDVLDMDRLVFIEKKMKKGAVDFHIAEDGETLYGICQSEGVQLESLMLYNKMKKDSKLAKGQKIYLRPATTAKPSKSK
jgi:LysM repeat protein